MTEIMERSLIYEGLKHYFKIEFPQRAGALKEFILTVLGKNDDIIYFRYTKIINKETGPVIIGIQTKTKSDVVLLINNMEKAGITYEKGKVLNTEGRVKENIYVVGWAKRGPSGVIGTNKSDAAAVIELLISDLKAPKNSGDLNDLIGAHKVITQTHWEAINSAEVSSGEPLGKPRVKVADKSELLRLGGL